MIFQEYFKMAIHSIRSNMMRSLLTMLGIIIGIASVITILAAGDGVRSYMNTQLEAVGTNTVIISMDTEEGTDSDHISSEDLTALADMNPEMVQAVTPVLSGFGTANFRRSTMSATIAAGTPGLETVQGVSMLTGSFYSESDNLSARNVCVIDDLMAQKFFGTTDVLGMEISLEYQDNLRTYRIVGVCQSPYGDFATADMMDYLPGTVYIPLNSALTLFNKEEQYESVYMISTDKSYNDAMGDLAIRTLEARHNNAGRDVYYAQNLSTQVDMINDIMGMITNFIVAVAAISLLVGGIGVMNIMLVSVTERTREIGIRKALGAKTNAILMQFLTESTIITLIGGIIGLIIGLIGGTLFAVIGGFPPVFTPTSILFTILFSAGVGIVFGVYPAKKAAQMSPIEALRHD